MTITHGVTFFLTEEHGRNLTGRYSCGSGPPRTLGPIANTLSITPQRRFFVNRMSFLFQLKRISYPVQRLLPSHEGLHCMELVNRLRWFLGFVVVVICNGFRSHTDTSLKQCLTTLIAIMWIEFKFTYAENPFYCRILFWRWGGGWKQQHCVSPSTEI
jgi:hypothetical protein